MKRDRHKAIIEMIANHDIETQEEMVLKLIEDGFDVTQATVSRDIKELKLTKIPTDNGKQRYSTVDSKITELNERYIRILKEGYLSIDDSQNIIVLKTVPGMAMAVGATLDSLKWRQILGCIAGDDTVLCVTRSNSDTKIVKEKLIRIVKGQ